jgi:hypothetical protein
MGKIHFLHIGKTGGTALKEALKEGAPDVVEHPHKTKLCDIPDGDKAFFFIREPCSRFVSGFYSRQRCGRPRRDVPWSKGERIAFEAYPTANSLAESLYTNDHEKAAAAMRSIIHVRSSIYDWIISDKYIRSRSADIILIGLQEQLGQDFQHLKDLGVVSLSASLPTDDIGTHRNPDNLDVSLSSRALENLRRWYKRDLRFYELVRSGRDQGSLVPDLSGLPDGGVTTSLKESVHLLHVRGRALMGRLQRSLRSS